MTTEPQCYHRYQCYQDILRERSFIEYAGSVVLRAQPLQRRHSRRAASGVEKVEKGDQSICDRRNLFAKPLQKQYVGCCDGNGFSGCGNGWAKLSDVFRGKPLSMATRIDASPNALVENRRRHAAKVKRPNAGLTRRIRAAIDNLVFGIDDRTVTKAVAAEAVGLTSRALRGALNKPAVLRYYRAQVDALREGERAGNLRTAIEIRDDNALKQTAAGQKVRLAAAAQLDTVPGDGRNHLHVNFAIGVATPGYVLDLSEPMPGARIIEHEELPIPSFDEAG